MSDTSLQKQASAQIQREMPAKVRGGLKTVPHVAWTQPRTRGCERVHTTFPSHMTPLALPVLHHWATAPLQWKEESAHQVLIRENNLKPQAPVTAAAPQAAQQFHHR